MKTHSGFDNLPPINNAVVSIGSFDGVHLGHRSIIDTMQATAKAIQGETVIISFHPHPRLVLYPHSKGKHLKLLNSLEEKSKLLEHLGIDHLIVVPFTKTFAATPHQAFIQNYLVEQLHTQALVVGANHHFGKDRQGSSADIKEQYGIAHNTQLQLVAANEAMHISSTLIRQLISRGDMQEANHLLGQHYFMHLYPINHKQHQITARLEHSLKLSPPQGTYQVHMKQGSTSIAAEVQLSYMHKTKYAYLLLSSKKAFPKVSNNNCLEMIF